MLKKTSSRPSWSRLGRILGRFETALGLMFIDLSLVFKAFRENSRFSKNRVSRAVLSPTWPVFEPTLTHLVPLWRALGPPRSRIGVNLGHLGTMLAPTWAILVPTSPLSTHLRANLSQIGTNLDELGAIMAPT